MTRFAMICLAASLAVSVAPHAFGWGSVTGPNGGAAYRGPLGAGAVRGPNGGTAVRGPLGAGVAHGPNGGVAVRGPYRGAAVRAPYGGGVYVAGVRPWTPLPYYGAVVAGVAIGTVIAATAVPPAPSPQLCWYWSSPAHTHGYWDYCGR
jgi:hypothetical protein